MSRAIECRANVRDYTLWIRFDDGLEGRVFLGNLLELGAFALWRDKRVFRRAFVDAQGVVIAWPRGPATNQQPAALRLDADVLWRDIAAREASPSRRLPPAAVDAAFQRFMAAAVGVPARRTRRARRRR